MKYKIGGYYKLHSGTILQVIKKPYKDADIYDCKILRDGIDQNGYIGWKIGAVFKIKIPGDISKYEIPKLRALLEAE